MYDECESEWESERDVKSTRVLTHVHMTANTSTTIFDMMAVSLRVLTHVRMRAREQDVACLCVREEQVFVLV